MNIERWQLGERIGGGRSLPLSNAISRTFGACECGFDVADPDVSASFTSMTLGSLTLVRYFGRGVHWAERRASHVRAGASDNFLFYLPHDSAVTIRQRGCSSKFVAGQIGFVNTRAAYFGQLESAAHGSFESSHIIVPGPMLRSRFPEIDRLAGRAIDIGNSLHGVFSAYVTTIDGYDGDADAPRLKALSNILFETLCSISDYALTTHDGNRRPVPPAKRALERIQTFVLANLTDPGLSVTMIAERLHLSPRYVHSAFEGTQWTANAWIRHHRLLECRKAIRSASMAGHTLTEIAFSWGFSDFSHFSRCYKVKFGCSPRQDRQSDDGMEEASAISRVA